LFLFYFIFLKKMYNIKIFYNIVERISNVIVLKARTGFAQLHADELRLKEEPLHGCWCESCHARCSIFDACCGTFPQHNTANQFFTSRQFDAYAQLGKLTMEHAISFSHV